MAPLILSTIWFGVAVALCWACAWVVVRGVGELEPVFGFVISDLLFGVGVAAGIIGLVGGLYVGRRWAKGRCCEDRPLVPDSKRFVTFSSQICGIMV